MQKITNIIAGIFQPYAFESITIDNTSGGIGLTASTIAATPTQPLKECQYVIMTLETAQIRYTIDGTAPTSSTGHILNPNDVLTLTGISPINNFRAIRTGGTSGTLMVTYER